MPNEIERKFIVPNEHHALFVGREGGVTMTQAYLSSSPTVRVRVVEAANKLAWAKMTVKGKSSDGGLVRSEWEWSIHRSSASGRVVFYLTSTLNTASQGITITTRRAKSLLVLKEVWVRGLNLQL